MEIKTKFSVGDKVKVLADKMIKTTCPFCEGKGLREVNGVTLYCQNCEDGIIRARDTDDRQLVEGIIDKIMLEVTEVQSEDDEWWYGSEEGTVGTREDYGVTVDTDKYYGNGTYNVTEIKEE